MNYLKEELYTNPMKIFSLIFNTNATYKIEPHFFKIEIIFDQVEPSYVKIFQGVEDSLQTISICLNNILLKVKKTFF